MLICTKISDKMTKRVEYFIAQRTDQRHESSGEGGVMMRVATIAIALSVAVMILTLSVVIGFKSEVHSRLTAHSGDVIISTATPPTSVSMSSIERCDEQIRSLIEEAAERQVAEVRRVTPFVLRSAVLSGRDGVEGVVLKGVDSLFDRGLLESGLVEGEVPDFGVGQSSRGAMISRELAAEYALGVGSKLELVVSDEQGNMRRDLYRVAGIFSTGTGEIEKRLIITDMRNVQRINGWGEESISGYEVSITPRSRTLAVAEQINYDLIYTPREGLDGYVAHSVERLFSAIFDWLVALDINALIVVVIMMIVALFNIVTALLIMVLERVQMIGVLKTLGMANDAIRRIFLHRAFAITLRGLVWGNGVALLLAFVQRRFEVIRLDESGYILDAVPIDLGAWWIVALNVGVVVTVLLVVVLPTRMVSSIEISKAVKFQ